MAQSAAPKKARGRRSLALLAGLGGLATAAAVPELTAAHGAINTATTGSAAGDVMIRVEAGRVYLHEGALTGPGVVLPDTPETRHLLDLLQSGPSGTTALSVRPTIMAGDGGAGFHWAPDARSNSRKNRMGTQGESARQPEPTQPDRTAKRGAGS